MNESVPAGAGDVDCVKALLAAHAEVNCKDDGGATALIRAAAAGRADCVKALLDNGADAKITVNDGKTALEMAVYGRREWSYKGTHQPVPSLSSPQLPPSPTGATLIVSRH